MLAKYSIYWNTVQSAGIPIKRCILLFIFNPSAYLNSGLVVLSLRGQFFRRSLSIHCSKLFTLIQCPRKNEREKERKREMKGWSFQVSEF